MKIENRSTSELHKPWPKQKKVRVAAVYGGIILAAALVLGSGMYWFGRVIGIFKPFNLYREVTDQALADDQLLTAYAEAMTTLTCTNHDWGYRYPYEAPLIVTEAEDEAHCSELTYPLTASDSGYIKLSRQPYTLARAVENKVKQFTQVETDSFSHPHYEATIIKGQSGTVPVTVIFLGAYPEVSYEFSIYPWDEAMAETVYKTVRGFTILEDTEQKST